MSRESDVDRTVSVSDDDVRVEKSFARDEFPVPAIKFRITAEGDAPAHVRLVDRIPEEFPMEGVGFHPDYESDNWTAYKDHRVEYERTFDPGESTVTVYGIRLEDPADAAGFLTEPILERPPRPGEGSEDRPGADVDDILGTDRSQLVRDALQGQGRLANQEPADPVDDPAAEPATAEPSADDGAGSVDADDGGDAAPDAPDIDAPTPRTIDSDLTAAVRREPASVAPVGAGADAAPADGADAEKSDDGDVDAASTETAGAAGADPDPSAAEGEAGVEAGSEAIAAGADAEDEAAADESGNDADAYVDIGADAEDGDVAGESGGDADVLAAAAAGGGLAATLAAEIRAGEVSDADLETLRGELDSGLPRSADVRIRRLQSQFADLDAYVDALEEFIDDEGTGAELVERLDAELEEVTAEIADLRDGLDAAADDREAIHDGVDALDDDLAATDDRLDDVEGTASAAADGVDDLRGRTDAVEDHLDDVESDIDDLVDDLDDVVADIRDVAADVDETEEYVARVDDDLEAVREDVSTVAEDVADAQESLSADVADLRAEVSALADELDRVDEVEAEIEELQTFRDRLNSAFGPGGGGDGDGA
jgi:predicted  nucleic acid-binding Zn-ribbon protein